MAVVPVHTDTKELLDELKIHPRETYNQVVRRLIDHWNKQITIDEEVDDSNRR